MRKYQEDAWKENLPGRRRERGREGAEQRPGPRLPAASEECFDG